MARRGRPSHPDILTPREYEVLALLREGLTNPQIADRLGITLDGAKYHVSEILGKLGVATREDAARWQYEEARPWLATVFVPFLSPWRRLSSMFGSVAGSAAKVTSISVLATAIGGLGLLALLLYLQNGDDDTPPHVDGAGELVWRRDYQQSTIMSVTPGTCGESETAERFGVPRMLRVEGDVGGPQTLLLGLEQDPYEFHSDDVRVIDDALVAPEGWELGIRVGGAPFISGPPRLMPNEAFLRRLDRPDDLFRYYHMYCDQEDGSPTGVDNAPMPFTGDESFKAPEGAPVVLEHVDGDYLSVDEALKDPRMGGSTEVVVGELGRREDLEVLDEFDWSYFSTDTSDVLWFIVLRLTHVGPVRPGEEYGMRVIVDPVQGVSSSSSCCLRLVAR